MKWTEGKIDDAVIRPAGKHTDQRGWLAEIFRSDEIDPAIMPQMGYVTLSHPGVTRGPHEHRMQTDVFGFVGPGNFKLRLWDGRKKSATYGNMMTIVVGEDNPMIVVIPPGIVHGYANVSKVDGRVLNFPNRLYAGKGKKEAVDDIRYEDAGQSEFVMD
jgi:dTDP-4-dehydrorhamnose 3,5-epimerase